MILVRRAPRERLYLGPQGPGHLPQTIVLSRRGGTLRAWSIGGYQTRHESVLGLIDAAEHGHGLADFGPVAIWTGDLPLATTTAYRSLAFATAPGFSDVP